MTDDLAVTCVDPDGRLAPVVGALRDRPAITVAVVDDVGGVAGTDPDCCVLLHAPSTASLSAVDGLAALDRLRTAHPDCPAAVYAPDPDSMPTTTRAFTHEVLDRGGDAAMAMAPEREDLIVRRIEQVAGRERHFQSDDDLLESLLESFPHQIFIKDDAGRFADVSAVTADEYGFDREQLRGLTDYELLPRTLAAELYEEEQEIMASGEPVLNKVEHFVDESGHSRWVSTTKAPRYDEAGAVAGIVGGTREVTAEKRHEHMVRAVHEASRDLVHAKDRTEVGEVTVAIAENVPALPRVQIALADEAGDGLDPVDSVEDRDVYRQYAEWYDAAYERGTDLFVVDGGDDAVASFDAAQRPVAALLPVGDHGVFGVTTGEGTVDEFTLDLSRILAANVEGALDRAARERELERQNERLEEFASIVSHDLRNPLSVASAYVELAKDDPQRIYLEKADDALDRMGQLTDELLTLAKKGQAVGDTEPVRLSAALREARETVADPALTVRTGDLGTVVADRSRLVELLENLLRNCLDHAATDGEVTVTVEPLPEGFAVADDGPGVPESEREAVFEMGYTDSDDGTGYGLYIVETIARAHGWSVRVTESEAGGARFEFTGVDAT
ncbi:PAS domain-containing sensor histidine kinase [Haloarcula litorea]|uniref:PAS domain-containing sensor histidine kinase n=1 Tax=Haloarcula litorea TaxID=3032579 RepID=UPI0023E7F6ED|nr:PAS domain-containing sensor histidine kinase [Halomicroarcula sp. GDY20]